MSGDDLDRDEVRWLARSVCEDAIQEAIAGERARLAAIISACPITYDYNYDDGSSNLDIGETLERIACAVNTPSDEHAKRMLEQGMVALGSLDETQYDTWVAWFKWRKMR